jgi:Flp pilus assembly protein TadD
MRNGWIASLVVAAGLIIGVPALAMTNDDPVSLSEVQELIDQGDFSGAVEKLEMYVEATPHDADGYNLLGFGYRQQEQYDLAKQAYDRALQLDPGHLGVHEYLGELYLKTNEPAKAEAELAILEGLCGTECEEYTTLAAAIAAANP